MDEIRLTPDLVTNAELFLLAGGTLTLQDWVGMSTEDRVAYAVAGHRLRLEQAVAIGRAVQDPNQVQAALDGGQAVVSSLLRQAVDIAAVGLTASVRRVE